MITRNPANLQRISLPKQFIRNSETIYNEFQWKTINREFGKSPNLQLSILVKHSAMSFTIEIFFKDFLKGYIF